MKQCLLLLLWLISCGVSMLSCQTFPSSTVGHVEWARVCQKTIIYAYLVVPWNILYNYQTSPPSCALSQIGCEGQSTVVYTCENTMMSSPTKIKSHWLWGEYGLLFDLPSYYVGCVAWTCACETIVEYTYFMASWNNFHG